MTVFKYKNGKLVQVAGNSGGGSSSESSGSSLPVGSIFASAIPQTDARVHLLDGSTILQTGVYETFANLIKALETSGQPITCTQEQFDKDVGLTGNCGKFVIDNENGTIRLPKITTFIQGLSSITNIGSSLEAGLPNITGSWTSQYNIAQDGGADGIGAIKTPYSTGQGYYGGSSATSDWGYGFNFDASRSNAIYGKSNTVQPNAIQYPYYIVLASGYKSSQAVNFDNIMNDVDSIMNDVNRISSKVDTKATLLEAYPVGSIYMSTNSTSPAQRFGGTWEQLKDRFLLGAGGTYSNGSTGGSKDAIVVSHTHSIGFWSNSSSTNNAYGLQASGAVFGGVAGNSGNNYRYNQNGGTGNGTALGKIDSSGSSGTGKNMPPYLVVYMWKRVG